MPEHDAIVLGERHGLPNYEYVNSTARLAATGFIPADIGKLARQTDNDSLWLLTDDSPATWRATEQNKVLVFEFGDGESASSLTANQTARIPYIPFDCQILSWRIEGDPSGSAVVDIQKSTADPPSYSSIAASAKPTLSSDTRADNSTLTGWTPSLVTGNALRALLESSSTCKQVTVSLIVRLT